eukprot:IDg11748t1
MKSKDRITAFLCTNATETKKIPTVITRRNTSRNVALLKENCDSHRKDLVNNREKVTIFTLSPNYTSFQQQIDMDVIAA